jgi:hypothetical protein
MLTDDAFGFGLGLGIEDDVSQARVCCDLRVNNKIDMLLSFPDRVRGGVMAADDGYDGFVGNADSAHASRI